MKIFLTLILLIIGSVTHAQDNYYQTNYNNYQLPPPTTANYYYQPISGSYNTPNVYQSQTIQYYNQNGSLSNTSTSLQPISDGYNVYRQDLNGYTQIGVITTDGSNNWNFYNYTQNGGMNINPSYSITTK